MEWVRSHRGREARASEHRVIRALPTRAGPRPSPRAPPRPGPAFSVAMAVVQLAVAALAFTTRSAGHVGVRGGAGAGLVRPLQLSRRSLVVSSDGEEPGEVPRLADDQRSGPSESELLSDIARFKEREAVSAQEAAESGPDIAMTIINGLGVILTCNFVIIVGLFGWFLVGAVGQLGFKNTGVIESFRGAWDPFILPLLTTHMALTFLSKGIEKVSGKEDEGSISGGWKI